MYHQAPSFSRHPYSLYVLLTIMMACSSPTPPEGQTPAFRSGEQTPSFQLSMPLPLSQRATSQEAHERSSTLPTPTVSEVSSIDARSHRKGRSTLVETAGALSEDPTPTEEDIETLIRHISLIDPPDRREAFLELLERGEPGYDEVFLVGLNEDDFQTLEVVIEYFRTHHPPRAIEPLLEVLLYLQGDKEMRDLVVEVLATFGGQVLDPVIARLTGEPSEKLAGGAGGALEQILVRAIDQSEPEVLNHFLEKAKPRWILLYGSAPPPQDTQPRLNEETFRILAHRLEISRDGKTIEGILRLISRLTRRRDLPETVSLLVPPLVAHLDGYFRRWALYALAQISDARATRRCIEVARRNPRDRFWALQALAVSEDPEAYPSLVKGLEDPRPAIHTSAAFLVRSEMIVEGAEPLIRKLERERGALCSSCVQALTPLRDEKARPILEARLAGAILADQANILRALLPIATPELAQRLMGWLEVQILAPARLGRISIAVEPGKEVLLAALLIIATDGGPKGQQFVLRVLKGLSGEAEEGAREVLWISQTLPRGLGYLLRAAALETSNRPNAQAPPAPLLRRPTGPVQPMIAFNQENAASEGTPGRLHLLRSSLFLLVPRLADAGTREALEDILLYSASPRDRVNAAGALLSLNSTESIPALAKALRDPYFQEGPYPLYRYPVRRLAARALQRLGVRVSRHADRSYTTSPSISF